MSFNVLVPLVMYGPEYCGLLKFKLKGWSTNVWALGQLLEKVKLLDAKEQELLVTCDERVKRLELKKEANVVVQLD